MHHQNKKQLYKKAKQRLQILTEFLINHTTCNLASCNGFEYSGTVTHVGDLITITTFNEPYFQPISKNDRKRGFKLDIMFQGIVNKIETCILNIALKFPDYKTNSYFIPSRNH